MCNYAEVIEQDVKNTLREHYGYGELSVKQFWKLEGEAICEEAYKNISDKLMEKSTKYERIVGGIEL